MRKWFRHVLLGAGAVMLVAGTAGNVAAQPANCGQIDPDADIDTNDLASLAAGTISPACNATGCFDINGTGGPRDLGDRLQLARFLAGGGTVGEPGRSAGEQNLLFRLCAPQPVCPGICPTQGAPLTGAIETNTVIGGLPSCPNAYISGLVTVRNRSTLTICPGTAIRAIPQAPPNPTAILVTRGSKINADGTQNAIVMTSADDPPNRGQGDWGGLVINGNAQCNLPTPCNAEGFTPGPDSVYGGNNPADLSAFLRFVRIEFSGVALSTDNELNVLTLNGVGRLSTIDHVQTNQGFDDGQEWFGGTAQGRFLVASGIGDDDFDCQIGYAGRNQFVLAQANNASLQASASGGSNGIECDNNEFDNDALPQSNPTFCNATLVGPANSGGAPPAGTRRGALLRRGVAGRIQNSIIEDWLDAAVVFQDPTLPPVQLACPVLRDISCNNSSTVTGTALCPFPGACDVANSIADAVYPTAVDNRYVVNPSIGTTQNCSALNSFFQSAPYRGAFNNTTNWLADALHPACPAGNPLNIAGGQRCWVSFDVN